LHTIARQTLNKAASKKLIFEVDSTGFKILDFETTLLGGEMIGGKRGF
jgi:hypothetical protein